MRRPERRFSIALLALSLVLTGPLVRPAAAEEAILRLGLRDVLVQAGRRGTEVLVSEERVRQAASRTWQAYTAFMPQVSAELSETRQYRNLRAQGIEIPGQEDALVGPFSSFEGRLRVTQIVFDMAAIQRLLAVRDGERVSRAQLVKARQDALAWAASLYLEAVRAEDVARLSEAGVEVAGVRSRLVHRRLRSGNASVAEVKEARALYLEACRRSAEATDAARTAKEDLLAALGYDPHTPLELDRERDREDLPSFSARRESPSSLGAHPDLRVAAEAVRQRRAEERVQWYEYLPKVNVHAEYGPSGEQPSDADEIYLFGGRVTMPVFEGGQRAFRIGEAASRAREQQLRTDETRRQLEADILEARRLTERSLLGLKAASARMAAAEERQRHALRRRQNGSGSEWELVEAGWARAQAREERSRAETLCLSSAIRYGRASGQLEAWTREISGGTYV